MIKVAIISPTLYLPEIASYKQNRYHLALAQRVLSDNIYRNFYKQKAALEDYVILDNGACELKESLSPERLLEAIEAIRPNLVILPDKLGDSKRTIKLSSDFLKNYSDRLSCKADFMGVAQGSTKKEWFDTYNYFLSIEKVSVIGISNTIKIFKSSHDYTSRVNCINYLLKENLVHKKIHLLGLPGSGHVELEKMNKFDFIEGTDTSAPVVHGAFGVQFIKGTEYTKIRTYLNPSIKLNEVQISLIKKNIDVIFKAGGYLQ